MRRLTGGGGYLDCEIGMLFCSIFFFVSDESLGKPRSKAATLSSRVTYTIISLIYSRCLLLNIIM
jgi:hypothetical protein